VDRNDLHRAARSDIRDLQPVRRPRGRATSNQPPLAAIGNPHDQHIAVVSERKPRAIW